MEASERDSTKDWAIPRGRGTSLIVELEAKVDEAVAIARASEDGVQAVGEVALDAARQARRAAEAAESASRAAAEARDELDAATVVEVAAEANRKAEPGEMPAATGRPSANGEPSSREPVPPLSGEARLRVFSERCDRVSARLRALGRRPGAPAVASAAEALRRRGD